MHSLAGCSLTPFPFLLGATFPPTPYSQPLQIKGGLEAEFCPMKSEWNPRDTWDQE